MRPERLDHVALYVSDPDAVAGRILGVLPFRVIEQTDEFVLVGRGPDLGKLTLFEGPPPRERGLLLRIGIGIPCGTVRQPIDLGEGLELVLVPTDVEGEVDLDHVALVTPDPVRSARTWLELGFESAPALPGGAERVRLDDAHIEFHRGTPAQTERPLLNHLGLLAGSLDEIELSVEHRRLHVNRFVDAENSRALFVRGPDGVEIEYIEHKPSFALA